MADHLAQKNPYSDSRLDRARAEEQLRRFLDPALRELQLAITYQIKGAEPNSDGPDMVVAFEGADEEFLLERNAELLLSLEYLAHRLLRLDPKLQDRLVFDCGNFRATRLEELKLSARVAAQRVRETGHEFRFNPMSARDRRLIHLELTGAAGVRTISEGSGDRRQLVIYPASQK